MEKLQLSVIIPVYKTPADSLLRALNSTSSLMLPHETVVVFDGDPDACLLEMVESCASYDAAVRHITIPHAGLAGARNAGVQASSGVWVTFLDADDEIIPAGVEELVAYGDRHGCQLVQGSYRKQMTETVERCGLDSRPKLFRGGSVSNFLYTVFLVDCGTSTAWSKIFLRSYLIDNHILFDTTLPIEDTPFMFDAVVGMDCVGFVPTCCYVYYRNDRSLVTSFREDYAQRIQQYLKEFKERVDSLSDARVTTSFEQYIVFYLLLVMLHYVFNPANGWNAQRQHVEFNRLVHIDLYQYALEHADCRQFSYSKRISAFVVRHHMFYVMKMICKLRNRQIHN